MKTQKAICTIRNPVDGAHDMTAVNAALALGATVVQLVSDCQSAIVYILETETPPNETD